MNQSQLLDNHIHGIHGSSGDITDLDSIYSSKESLDTPARQSVVVVLHVFDERVGALYDKMIVDN